MRLLHVIPLVVVLGCGAGAGNGDLDADSDDGDAVAQSFALSTQSIEVSISDGTTTLTGANAPAGFALSVASPPGVNSTLNLLANCAAPCARYFPSGSSAQQAGDTFRIQDYSSS